MLPNDIKCIINLKSVWIILIHIVKLKGGNVPKAPQFITEFGGMYRKQSTIKKEKRAFL